MDWLDFNLDDPIGPLLKESADGAHRTQGSVSVSDGSPLLTSCRSEERLSSPDARNGAVGDQTKDANGITIQGTGQENRLARMAGTSSHDSFASEDRTSAGSCSNSSERKKQEFAS